jgi:hypothetical protein
MVKRRCRGHRRLMDHDRDDRDRRREKQGDRNDFQMCPKIGSGN